MAAGARLSLLGGLLPLRGGGPGVETRLPLLYQHGVPLGYLATQRKDEGLRIHPVCPIVDGGEFHYHGGAVAHDDMIGGPEGQLVRSARNTQIAGAPSMIGTM